MTRDWRETIPGVIQAVADDGGGRLEIGWRRELPTIFAQAESRMPGNLVANLEIADIDKNPFQTRYVERR
jgi:hypothetical protein